MMTSTQLSNQEPYLIIHADGKITASEKMQPSETAARVLECMKTQWMEDSQSKQIRELQERIKRLEEAGDAMVDKGWNEPHLAGEWRKAKEAKL
jgi:methyl-accepting chemotaxis protein